MKKVRVEDAVGLVLAHDITEIIPGEKKDVAFRRGRIIEKGDVERLLDLGKSHIFVTDGSEREVHEDEAGRRIAAAAMDGHMELPPAKEGRINIVSRVSGLVAIDRRRLTEMNRIKDVLFTVVPDRYPVKPGDIVAATRIVPLYIPESLLQQAEARGEKGDHQGPPVCGHVGRSRGDGDGSGHGEDTGRLGPGGGEAGGIRPRGEGKEARQGRRRPASGTRSWS